MKLPNLFSAKHLADDRKEPYLQVFLIGFALFFIVALPIMILTGGYFIYYGDFNSQQIPFYHLAHDAVQNGEIGWNWNTDLGANFIGSYSFYLLGSPFFWLSLIFPSTAVPYLMPWLLALKHGVAALTSYAFIRRFVRSRRACIIGALLYAYSGFQLFNIFFNHFHDVTAFFPLLLIALEERVNNERRGVFAVCVGFMAMLNYYFFTGQVVFVLLYFAFRCPCEDFHVDLRKFFSIALESVIGVMLSAFMLLPSALAILSNNRVGTYLTGLDMVTYSDRTRLWRIIQSFFMIPDVPARPNLLTTEYAKWASIGGYLPLFSMTGVAAFLSQKKKHWASRLTLVCILCAFVPVFNSMFYTFNNSYYARWYYMPILIMAMMTAYALDNAKIRFESGIFVCGAVLLLFGVIGCFPTKAKEGELQWFGLPKYPWYFWFIWLMCVLMLYVTYLLIKQRQKGKPFLQTAVWATALSALGCTVAVVYFGVCRGQYPMYYVQYAIKGGSEIEVEPVENQFFRVDMCSDYDNYPMFWGYPSMRCFQSVVPTSIMDFYSAVDITRDVASRADKDHYPLRAMFNVKYYFDKASDNVEDGKENEYAYDIGMPGFRYMNKQNGFYVYENDAYLPMGVPYDACISTETVDKMTNISKERVMLTALAMTDEQIEKYRDVLHEVNETQRYQLNDDNYVTYCQKKAEECCKTFTYDSNGFEAAITLEKPQFVFFSVPAEGGWSAEVNGKPADIELVNYGFMAVLCEAGENTITFSYETPGLRIGVYVTIGGALLLLLYLLLMRKNSRQTPKTAKRTHCYDYDSCETMPTHAMYLRYVQEKYDEMDNQIEEGEDNTDGNGE